jgi:D-alanyl-D-alanine carboxypeptidase/D-alanyl-D-alanine-endopeptidase (penicillin-binding protein 4)
VGSSAFRLPLSAAVAALALALPAAAPGATLRQDLQRALKPVHGAASVYDTRARRTVFALRAGTERPLASNTKLFTAAAALRGLPGPLITSVHGDPSGDLFLVGGGDPALGKAQIEELARQVQARGITSIAGGIVGDGSRFEPPGPLHPEVAGVVGALVYDRGRAVDGGPLQTDPALAAATRFDDALEALGIRVAGGQRSAPAPAGAPLLASVQSAPVEDLIALMNKPSDNFVAEMLTKALSPLPGSTIPGADAIERLTGRRAALGDGTGLSPDNRATARDVVAMLRANPGVKRSLPVAGREGTVAGRMKGTRGRCRVKTGTVRGSRVSALSGYCGRYVFSVLVRGGSVDRAQRVQDRVAARLARR